VTQPSRRHDNSPPRTHSSAAERVFAPASAGEPWCSVRMPNDRGARQASKWGADRCVERSSTASNVSQRLRVDLRKSYFRRSTRYREQNFDTVEVTGSIPVAMNVRRRARSDTSGSGHGVSASSTRSASAIPPGHGCCHVGDSLRPRPRSLLLEGECLNPDWQRGRTKRSVFRATHSSQSISEAG
jgi:hypothetical protein